jgi:hypothetical protein
LISKLELEEGGGRLIILSQVAQTTQITKEYLVM